jgi:hypothetical protein
MGDAWLILKDKYHVLYSRRLKNSEQLLALTSETWIRELLSIYITSLKFKIEPKFEYKSSEVYKKWWLTIRVLHEKLFREYEEYRLGYKINDWMQYRRIVRREIIFGIGHWLRQVIRKVVNGRLPENQLIGCLPLIIYGIHNVEDEKKYYCQVARDLKIWNTRQETIDWPLVMEHFVRHWHP